MSSFPDSEIRVHKVRSMGLSPGQYAAVATTLAVVGLLAIWPAIFSLWSLWISDALKSIGMVIPLVSMFLVLRVWKSLSWEAAGTWWGLVLILIAMVASQIQERALVILVVSPHWSTELPPPSLVLLAYGSGVVLLFGGVQLFRAALFPILLLWFANPVPHAFSLLVDLPLQRASAHIARAFAMNLGYSLTPDHLRLMFTPDFGMFIAPGCDGIRGSVTMGFIALIAGYVYRFRWYANALVAACAVLLGYVFNLARLCLLVLYYIVALHFPALQGKAENADYLIGAGLFLLATMLLFAAIHRLRSEGNLHRAGTVTISEPNRSPYLKSGTRWVRLAAMGGTVVCGCAGLVQAYAAIHPPATGADPVRFPEQLGNYTLVRSWNETIVAGQVVYVWAQYAPANGGTPISIGVSPEKAWHDPLICHTVRGDYPLWQGPLQAMTADGTAISFSSAFYSDGVTRYFEASTECRGATCGELATERKHFGFIFSRLDADSVFNPSSQRPVPVLLRAETVDVTLPADAARQHLTKSLQDFLASVRLDDLTRPFDR